MKVQAQRNLHEIKLHFDEIIDWVSWEGQFF